jgi:hypothetical protein
MDSSSDGTHWAFLRRTVLMHVYASSTDNQKEHFLQCCVAVLALSSEHGVWCDGFIEHDIFIGSCVKCVIFAC